RRRGRRWRGRWRRRRWRREGGGVEGGGGERGGGEGHSEGGRVEGGDGGGKVVAKGTPEKVAKVAASHTGRYLKDMLVPKKKVAAE
ncbi:MAG: hypothetical protein VX228_04415, partial [Pseudomonadota bacterium]|nr:hypothetical protein [Pseudomonadota bacterium]